MADSALRTFTGDTVCCVGEWDGDTGTAAFQQTLLRDWRLMDAVALPNWGDTCYELLVWQRKGAACALESNNDQSTVLSKHSARRARDAVFAEGPAHDAGQGAVATPAQEQAGGLRPLATACCACGSTGTAQVPLRRCRLTCCFAFCSQQCLDATVAAAPDVLPRQCGVLSIDGQPEARPRLKSYRSELAARQCGVDAASLRYGDDRVFRDVRHRSLAPEAPQTQRRRGKRKRRGGSDQRSQSRQHRCF